MKIFAIVSIVSVITLMLLMLFTDLHNRGFEYPAESYNLTLGKNQYNLIKPEQRWNMPSVLKEISGIAFKDNRTLMCVQDENGTVYFFDLVDGSINHKIVFGKSGDYEDIALVDNTIFVLKSNGQLYRVDITDNKEADTDKVTTTLSEKNDTEGLAYDASNKSLLIACKNDPFINHEEDKGRAIYSYSLTDSALNKTPIIFIEKKKFNEAIQKLGFDKKKHYPFLPSGIAIHPVSGQIVVICSVGKIMLILDQEGNIENMVPLDSKLFVQPEGICFSPEGDLFISSEGKIGKGYILKF